MERIVLPDGIADGTASKCRLLRPEWGSVRGLHAQALRLVRFPKHEDCCGVEASEPVEDPVDPSRQGAMGVVDEESRRWKYQTRKSSCC